MEDNNFLRNPLKERVYNLDENNSEEDMLDNRNNRIIMEATDVTGSFGVWGIY